ncbi:DUF302 domain-containing protein [Chitinophaga silvatica]|uniref:DUF302 domain-containing protein n=1 Tax=Chitinophaga silvatica TaxID=2282649 RepID=A0A3E1Y8Z4_9BACT|nr:DUF302 domain-containing protein [Chitinophaga silvatica]RFS21888.1 DUF302 domain-containing protein [Chitinophaga silvatica]
MKLITTPSKLGFIDTVTKIKQLITDNGVKAFAVIDHSAAAADAGLQLQPTTVLIFGNPAGGTQLMYRNREIAWALPLKVLIWEDEKKVTFVTYKNPEEFNEEFNLPPDVHGITADQHRFIQMLVSNVAS